MNESMRLLTAHFNTDEKGVRKILVERVGKDLAKKLMKYTDVLVHGTESESVTEACDTIKREYRVYFPEIADDFGVAPFDILGALR